LSVALKTLAVILSIIIIIISALTMFAPMVLADFNKKVGNNTLAASFTIIEYNRNKDINDLADIVELSISRLKTTRILKYSELLIDHSKFDDFCEYKDNNNDNSYISASYKQYIYGWNVTALYKKGNKELAFERAKGITPDDYSQNNAMEYLIFAVVNANDSILANDILLFLQDDILSGINGEEQELAAERLAIDIELLESILQR